MSWIDSPANIVGGLLAGVVFGFLLQKGQVTKYRVIVGQFLFTDNTVLKIMLSAIVVGSVGVYGMLGLGLIEHLHIKAATLAANALGGLIFGVGMSSLGYCPGTGVGAIAEGSRHAAWGGLGMLFGAAAYTFAYPAISGILEVADYGKVSLADVTGVSPWVWVAFFAVVSGAVFALIHKIEAKKAPA